MTLNTPKQGQKLEIKGPQLDMQSYAFSLFMLASIMVNWSCNYSDKLEEGKCKKHNFLAISAINLDVHMIWHANLVLILKLDCL